MTLPTAPITKPINAIAGREPPASSPSRAASARIASAEPRMLPKMWLMRKVPVVTYRLHLPNSVSGSGWCVRVA